MTLSAGGSTQTTLLSHGYHVLEWSPGRLPPRVYQPEVSARDLAGNVTKAALPQVEVAWDTQPPQLTAVRDGVWVHWGAEDPGTPWLKLRVALRRGSVLRLLYLGKRPLGGLVRLRLPPGSWEIRLIAVNSAGKKASVALGSV